MKKIDKIKTKISASIAEDFEEKGISVPDELLQVPRNLIEQLPELSRRLGPSEESLIILPGANEVIQAVGSVFFKHYRRLWDFFEGKNKELFTLWVSLSVHDRIYISNLPAPEPLKRLFVPKEMTRDVPDDILERLPDASISWENAPLDCIFFVSASVNPEKLREMELAANRNCFVVTGYKSKQDEKRYSLFLNPGKRYSHLEDYLQFEELPENFAEGWLPPSEREDEEEPEPADTSGEGVVAEPQAQQDSIAQEKTEVQETTANTSGESAVVAEPQAQPEPEQAKQPEPVNDVALPGKPNPAN